MALIKCPECGRHVSDKAGSCPGCGFPIAEIEESGTLQEPESSMEINGVEFDILEIQKKCFFQSVANVTKKVMRTCQCEQDEAEAAVYGYFLSTHGERPIDEGELREKISHAKSWDGKKAYCPYCLSRNIDIRQTVSESTSRGRSEVRKKSAVTRAGNKAGRSIMIGMTGGLWALTPKKSKYNEVSRGRTTYSTVTTKTCMDCGRVL